MKITNILCISGLLLIATSCSDYLETETPDQFSDLNFWTGESNVRTYNWEFYELFEGFGNGSTPGSFYFTSFTDDQASPSFQQFPVSAPASSGSWDWYYIRKANVMLERIDEVPISEEAKNHWKGIARFFRALDYFNKVQLFGDVPWIGRSLDVAETDLIYKPRDPREQVMDSILADIEFAVENLRVEDEENTVNRDVALALKSRVCLYAGTYRKYHTELGLPNAAQLLLEAKEASETLMQQGYTLGGYKELYSSMDLAGNSEVLLYKKYLAGILTHSVVGYTNSSTQMQGLTKSAIEAYPMADGLPISQSPLYMGDDNIEDLRTNRGQRLLESISDFLAYEGNLVDGLSSSTGYRPAKFLQPLSNQLAPQNETDAPIFWLAEVLLNYAEASAELADLGEYVMTQADLDNSVNLLRNRAGVAPLVLTGADNVSASGVQINDPKRDADVSPLLWEVRRERRIELMMDGFRYQDLMRWKKGEYLDIAKNPDCVLGAKVPDNPDIIRSADGYITPYEPGTSRTFMDPKHYLSPIPTGQISLYPEGQLGQNPGWE